MKTLTTTAALYCGTYAKYNNGSIAGDWLKLEDFANAEEFIEACLELHNDEEDPELMFQDFEGFPKQLYSESLSASEIAEIYDYLEIIEGLSNSEREAFEIFTANDSTATFDQFRDAYRGEYSSESEFADQLADELGYFDAMKKAGISTFYFDTEAFTRDIFINDYWYESGHVFSNH